MSNYAAGVLTGLRATHNPIPVLGVIVGADPKRRLSRYAPPPWVRPGQLDLIRARVDYHTEVDAHLGGIIRLDPIYESKCYPYTKPCDLFWIVGIRPTVPK